ncbi:MAG: dehydrogenase with different specificity [Candidatus Sulfotelmatobacter sp.]|nr:dehydrogenase with different specificity [Candidatus Sulfotelmatobacter sp.]
MVNIDNALRIAVDEVVGENLHVAGQHHKVGMVRVDQRMDLFFRLVLIFFRDRDDSVRNSVKVGDGLVVGVIRNDQRDFAGEFAALMTIEKIDQAVIVFRNQNDHARAMRR